jgi:hypothetical protein
MSVHLLAGAAWATGVYHTLAEHLGCYPGVVILGAYLDDVALDGVLYDNRQGCLYLRANKRHIAFGALCLGAINTSCPWIWTVFVLWSH